MKKFEISVAVFGTVSLILDLLDVPGSNVMTIVTLPALAMFYMYLGFAIFNDIHLRSIFKKQAYQHTSAKRIIGAVLTGFVLAITILGILFRFRNWPGASFNIGFGVIALPVINLVGRLHSDKDKSGYYARIFMRSAVIWGIGLILMILPRETWIEMKYRNYPGYVDALKKAMKEPGNSVLWDSVDYQRQIMEYEKEHK